MTTRQPYDQYKGWSILSPANPWLTLRIAPELGGRIMQISLGDYDFLFVNPALEGQKPGKNGLSEQGTWLNFGGEKIWPAPQGWGSPDQWPGPPDPVLDSGAYTLQLSDDENQVQLSSPVDPHTGLQIRRIITVSENRAEVRIDATFINQSQQEREWSIWPVMQMNTPDYQDSGRYQVVCPTNPASCFDNGFLTMHGLVNNPQFARNEAGNLIVTYQYLIGKIGLDSTAGWVAFCDRQLGKVLVATYQPQPEARYPDNTSVQIWTQGRGMIYSRNRIAEFPNDITKNPPYLELELLAPLQTMQPDEQSYFTYRLLACTIPEKSTVQHVLENGVVSVPLTTERSGEQLRIQGKFGLFLEGFVQLHLNDMAGNAIELPRTYCWEVSPMTGFVLDTELDIKKITAKKVQITLALYDLHGRYVDQLAHLSNDTINQ